MSDEEVEGWISSLGENTEGTVQLQQFLKVFAAMTRKMSSEEFKGMIADLST
jgi:Ca2+-binding EF-hand superfamily protein